ncbi:MAG TPA: hypothetical protein PLN69_07490 [bacterium]|nr:hypothetical protein [bacterium]
MVKMLMIICSSEISDKVTRVLSKSDIEGYARFEGTGTNIEEKSAYSRDVTWPGCTFIIPAEESQLRPIIHELKGYAGKCEIEPCLKLILSPVDEFY